MPEAESRLIPRRRRVPGWASTRAELPAPHACRRRHWAAGAMELRVRVRQRRMCSASVSQAAWASKPDSVSEPPLLLAAVRSREELARPGPHWLLRPLDLRVAPDGLPARTALPALDPRPRSHTPGSEPESTC